MRSKRITKFRKKDRSLMIMLKMGLIVYLVLFMAGYIVSNTTAYYSSDSQVSQQITTGVWDKWDESDLSFVRANVSSEESCPVDVSVTLTNKGEGAMEASSTYTVYYVEKGDPEADGEPEQLAKDEDVIDMLEPGGTFELTYTATKSGVYQFAAAQHDDHPDEQTIWSEQIHVTCEAESDDETTDTEQTSSQKKNNQTASGSTDKNQEKTKDPKKEKADTKDTDDVDKDSSKTKEKTTDTPDKPKPADKSENKAHKPVQTDGDEITDDSHHDKTPNQQSVDSIAKKTDKSDNQSSEEPETTKGEDQGEKTKNHEMAQS